MTRRRRRQRRRLCFCFCCCNTISVPNNNENCISSYKKKWPHLTYSSYPERFSRWDLFTSRFSRFFLALLLLLLLVVVVGGIVVRFASFCIFQTATAHFFFFTASVELSKRSESNGSSLKFFFTMVAQTNNENARSLTRDSRFARFLRASYPCRTRCVSRPVRFETESTRASDKRTRISWTHIKNTRSNFI